MRGMKSLTSLVTLGARHSNTRQEDDEWNHWVFLRMNGYEVHLSGRGVPAEAKDLDVWTPILDDISTLIFRPSYLDMHDLSVNAEAVQLMGGMKSVVGKLGPVLASDYLSWVAGSDPLDFSCVKELHVKSYVAEKIVKDYDLAEELFRKSLAFAPMDADVLGDFALFMQEVRGDYEQAESLFRQAIQVNPDHDKNLDNFAIFLHEVRHDYDEAELFYLRALAVQPEHALHLGNFALFLHEVRGELDQAEDCYRRSLRLDASDATVLGNFALFLHDTRRDDDLAEKFYRRAVELDGTDGNCLGNFALFLKNVRQDYDAAEAYFIRALQADPTHAAHLGNFALFMKNVRQDYDAAEEYYHRALRADPNDPNNLGNFALFMKNLRQNDDVAEDLYRRSVQVDPNNVSRLANFVQLLLAQGRIKDGLPLLDKAIAMQSANDAVNLELWFYVLAHDLSRFDQALGRIKGYLLAGVRSKGWDLSANCKWAQEDAHPQMDFLDALAQVIGNGEAVTELDHYGCWVEAVAV